MEDIKLSSTIWKVIICVEKRDMTNATKLCGDARKECDQLCRTINMQGTKEIKRLKEFITTVEKKPNNIRDQTQRVKEDFEKVILPFLKENIRSTEKAALQKVTPKKRSDATNKEYLKGHVKHFIDIFDNMWPEAHDALESYGFRDEKDIARLLLELVERAFTMNRKDAERELSKAQRCAEQIVTHGIIVKDNVNEIEGNIAEEIRAYRYLQAKRAIPRAQKDFMKAFLNKHHIDEKKINKDLEEYAMKCVEVTWYLCAEDPPVCMVLVLDEGTQQFDETLYEPSTKRGAMIDYILWPALKHSENGSVLVKGKAECKN